MKFKQAVLSTPALATAYRPGLQALNAADAARIISAQPRLLAGSVDVDSTLTHALPDAARWDYAVGVRSRQESDTVIWIEVHPASSTGEIRRVLAKLTWLKGWVAESAPNLNRLPREYVWVATGSVAFPANSPHRRQLAAAGLRFAGNQYRIQTSAR